MDVYFFVRLFHPILGFIASCLTLYFLINIVFQKNILKKSVNASLTMSLNFIFVFIFAILSMIYNIYLITFWRPDKVIYDSRILYITGIIPWIFINLNSIIEFFLCFDRCLALIFPFNYNKKCKKISVILSLIGLLGMAFIVIYFNSLILAFPSNMASTNCSFFSCLVSSTKFFVPTYTVHIKILFLLSNLMGSVILATLIKLILNGHNEIVKKLNKTVLIMALCTTFVELIPFIGAQAFSMLTGLQIQNFIGPYGFTVSTTNITLSSGIYYKAFKKNSGNFVPAKIIASANTPSLFTDNVR